MPGTFRGVIAAETDQVIFNGSSGERLASKNKIKLFSAGVLIKSEPAQSLFGGNARRYLERNVCLDVVSCFIKLRIRIDHARLTVICCIEYVKIAVSICLEQNTHMIAFVKLARGIGAHSQTIRVAQEKRQAQAHAWQRFFGCTGSCAAATDWCRLGRR